MSLLPEKQFEPSQHLAAAARCWNRQMDTDAIAKTLRLREWQIYEFIEDIKAVARLRRGEG